MKLFTRKALGLAAVAVVLGACGDDNDNGGNLPGIPGGVQVSQLSLTSVKVTWSTVSGASSYTVQRSVAPSLDNFTNLATGVTNLEYDDTGLTEGVEYRYRVAAVNSEGTGTYSTAVPVTTGEAVATLSGNITASRTLYADTLYTLSGYVKVQSGAILTIQPGTRIIGDTLTPGSSLWILRGAQINANGTAAAPIVFTSARSAGNRKPGDWGGIIIIGNGIINRTGNPILTEGAAAGVAENYAGGNNNADNSGTIRYVRIEFAGYDISNGGGQELNALSMYAVGRGTTLEYVQTMAGLDDSFEWWGGAVDGRYLVSYESGDDHFDWTEGYQGRNQFLIALQTQRLVPQSGAGTFSADPRGFEGDGCDPAVSGCTVTATAVSTPYSMPVFANYTMVGPGQLAGIPDDGNGTHLRRGTGGTFTNGVMARWKGLGISIRDAWTDSLFIGSGGRDSLAITSIILTQNRANLDTAGGAGFAQAANWPAGRLATLKQFGSNVLVDTLLGISVNPAGLDWTPKAGSPADAGATDAPGARTAGFFGGTWVNTTYLGAGQPGGTKWWQGWTAYTIN